MVASSGVTARFRARISVTSMPVVEPQGLTMEKAGVTSSSESGWWS